MWKVNQSMNQTYTQILKPFDTKEIYISNEAFSKHQCWIEGSLDMAYDILELLDTYTRSTQKGGIRKIKNKKLKKKPAYYDLKTILRHRNWIILKIGGKYKIYDVGKWMKKHPGGRQNLRNGIQANKYYLSMGKRKNGKVSKYPKSPIELFKEIGPHTSGNVIQKMLSKDNKYIQFIGYYKKFK